jgi:hypothetical protein
MGRPYPGGCPKPEDRPAGLCRRDATGVAEGHVDRIRPRASGRPVGQASCSQANGSAQACVLTLRSATLGLACLRDSASRKRARPRVGSFLARDRPEGTERNACTKPQCTGWANAADTRHESPATPLREQVEPHRWRGQAHGGGDHADHGVLSGVCRTLFFRTFQPDSRRPRPGDSRFHRTTGRWSF